MKRILTFLMIGGLLLIPALSIAVSLDDLVSEALVANADLNAVKSRWEQAAEKQSQVTSLDDPMLSFAFSNYPVDSYSADDFAMTGNEIRLSQKLPYPGKLGAKGEAAKAEADWFEAVYHDSRLQTARQVKDTWYRLYFLERAKAVIHRSITVLDDVIRLAETRYATGQALQQDVLKAQVERSRFLDRLWEIEQQEVAARAELQQLLNRTDPIEIELPASLPLTDVDQDVAQLLEAAEQARPQFAAYASLLERYQAQEKLAQLNYNPDITLWAGYRFRDNDLMDGGTDFASAGLSINLPIFREKRRAAVAEATSALRTARQQRDGFRARLQRNLREAYARMQQTGEQLELYRQGLVPQATQSYQAAIAAYQVGKVEFLTLLDALLTLHKLEIEQERSAAEYQRSVARLEAESGVALIGPSLERPNETAALKGPGEGL